MCQFRNMEKLEMQVQTEFLELRNEFSVIFRRLSLFYSGVFVCVAHKCVNFFVDMHLIVHLSCLNLEQ